MGQDPSGGVKQVMAKVIDGNQVAAEILESVRVQVERRLAAGGSQPRLAAVLVGDDQASERYVRGKRADCDRVGISSSDHRLPGDATTGQVVALVSGLNQDPSVSGILVQLPLPPQVDTARVIREIDPARDVDGLHPISQGNLLLGRPGLRPCTPVGLIELLDHAGIECEGARAVVVGRSSIVGRPASLLLLERNATVTVCHSRTRELAAICREADILVAALGRAHAITPDMVKPGAAVLDVGINRLEGKLTGDVDPAVAEVAGWLTPVPGGVGPMTRAILVRNTLLAEQGRNG